MSAGGAVRLVDALLPRSLRLESDDVLLRARLTVIVGLVGGFAIIAAVMVTTESPPAFVRRASYGLSLGFFATPLLIRGGVRLARVQQLVIGLMWSYAAFLALVTGGRDTAALVTAILIPLVAILCVGPRAGLFWSVAISAACLAIGIALQLGFRPPVAPDAKAVGAWNLWAASIAVCFSLALATSWERLRSGVEAELRSEKRRADGLHAEQRAADHRFRIELQALVDERTQALERTHAELRRAERLASIGTLAAGVAHEINNPIGGILLSAQYALASAEHPDREAIWRSALEESEAQAVRCARIVKGLLHFSAGGAAPRTPQDLNALVRSGLEALNGTMRREDLARVEPRLEPQPIWIAADPLGIEQVVVNLVRNAIEASAQVDAPVRVITASGATGAWLRIEDGGEGIRKDDLPRVFDPFFTTRERLGGTGLGLSIVHGIVRDHGGSIEVESRPGQGTRIHVLLPAEAEPKPPR